MAAGQVDVLVGLPTLNNADTVAPVVRAAHVGLPGELARERTLLINADSGSTRRHARRRARRLDRRHRHPDRLAQPAHPPPHQRAVSRPARARRRALRTIFAAADLLQARAVVVLDPEVTSVTPEWVAALVRPVLAGAPTSSRRPMRATRSTARSSRSWCARWSARPTAAPAGAARGRVRLLGAVCCALPRAAGLGWETCAPAIDLWPLACPRSPGAPVPIAPEAQPRPLPARAAPRPGSRAPCPGARRAASPCLRLRRGTAGPRAPRPPCRRLGAPAVPASPRAPLDTAGSRRSFAGPFPRLPPARADLLARRARPRCRAVRAAAGAASARSRRALGPRRSASSPWPTARRPAEPRPPAAGGRAALPRPGRRLSWSARGAARAASRSALEELLPSIRAVRVPSCRGSGRPPAR